MILRCQLIRLSLPNQVGWEGTSAGAAATGKVGLLDVLDWAVADQGWIDASDASLADCGLGWTAADWRKTLRSVQ